MPRPYRPRQFHALAKPRAGDPDGHGIVLVEVCGRSRRERVLTRHEAEQIRAELDGALRAFFVGESIIGEGPRACTAPFPFREHSTLEEVG